MTHIFGVWRMLAGMLVCAAPLAWAGLAPAVARQVAPVSAAITEELRLAASFLCAHCRNDIEAEGVNRPMRRVMLAGPHVARAEDLALQAAAAGRGNSGTLLAVLRRARQALDELDEAAALRAIAAARRALGG
jgi:hypothetical protein